MNFTTDDGKQEKPRLDRGPVSRSPATVEKLGRFASKKIDKSNLVTYIIRKDIPDAPDVTALTDIAFKTVMPHSPVHGLSRTPEETVSLRSNGGSPTLGVFKGAVFKGAVFKGAVEGCRKCQGGNKLAEATTESDAEVF